MRGAFYDFKQANKIRKQSFKADELKKICAEVKELEK